MSSTAAKPTSPLESPNSASRWSVLLPYVIAIAAQLPLLLYYGKTLWGLPHFTFFPLALIVVGVFAFMRWPKGFNQPFFERKTSLILFMAGIVFGVGATVFSFAWFSAVSCMFLVTSLFARTKDAEIPGKSLMVVALPLLVLMFASNNVDSRIITTLQRVSANISSWYLDLLNFKHFSPGTTLNFPNSQYEVEQACSGVQSFFTLLFCTTILVISFRRPWYRAILLLISAGVWAVFMNSMRILTIPIAEIMFNMNLKDGLPHDLLGYSAMLIAIGMIFSTDQLMEFVFGSGRRVGKSRYQSDEADEPDDLTRDFPPVSTGFKRLGLIAAIAVMVLGSMQFLDFARSLSQPSKVIRAFSSNVIIDLDEYAISRQIESSIPADEANTEDREFLWLRGPYDREDRTRGSDFGQRSDSWQFKSRQGLRSKVSLDQTFPGWHELTTCYRNIGWRILPGAREKISTTIEIDGKEVDWSYIECDMEDPTTGQAGFLLFCFVDAEGQPISAPIEWGKLRSFVERAKNRMFHSLRSTLFQGEAYQMQIFIQNPSELRQTTKEEIRSQFLQIRKELRESVIKYAAGETNVESVDPENSGDNADAIENVAPNGN